MQQVERLRTVLLWCALLIFLIVLGIAFTGEKTPIVQQQDTEEQRSVDATVELKNASYSTTNKDNVKEWDLKAQTATYFQDAKKVMLENLSVNLYRSGNVYRLSGSSGEFNTETRDIWLRGNVIGILPDNSTIAVDSIFYDHTKRIMTTEEKVLIKRKNFSMEGIGMLLSLETQKLSILGNVKALEKR